MMTDDELAAELEAQKNAPTRDFEAVVAELEQQPEGGGNSPRCGLAPGRHNPHLGGWRGFWLERRTAGRWNAGREGR